jgi:Helix-turn-helix domain
MTMKRDLLTLLGRCWVSPLMALKKCGCMSLAQRVSEWRASGLYIADKWVKTDSGKRFKAYKLIRPTKRTA